eukprot:23881-Prymnesium_polylepis.1
MEPTDETLQDALQSMIACFGKAAIASAVAAMECASDAVSTAPAPSSPPVTPMHEQEGGQTRRVGGLPPGLGLASPPPPFSLSVATPRRTGLGQQTVRSRAHGVRPPSCLSVVTPRRTSLGQQTVRSRAHGVRRERQLRAVSVASCQTWCATFRATYICYELRRRALHRTGCTGALRNASAPSLPA